uniref:Glutathione S-transferase n=1 Tax=Panagrolaimus sp. JU765 TaxID=591449 RepID=A0AC34QPC7_9BILA
MDKLELVSLNGRGRAEALRMLLIVSKASFLDHRVNLAQWKEFKRREQLPDDTKLPLLRINGKRTIVGSVEIGKFIASEFGLYGKTKAEESQIDDVVNLVENLQPNLAPVIRATLAKDFIKRKEAWAEYKETTLAPILEKLTEKLDGNDFFVGKRLSWADIIVAEILSRFASCFDSNFIHNHPSLKHHLMSIEKIPSLAKYIGDRPAAAF